jgi:hypothetical protein
MAKRGHTHSARTDNLHPQRMYPRGVINLTGGPRPYLWIGWDGEGVHRGHVTTYTLSGPVRLRKLARAILRTVKPTRKRAKKGKR